MNVVKVFLPAIISFLVGILITPTLSYYFYKFKFWKKKSRNDTVTSVDFKKVHSEAEAAEMSTPCVGGIIIWMSVLITILIIFILSYLFPSEITTKLNFLSRNQTLLPLALFILGSLLGLVDDGLEIVGKYYFTRDSKWYTALKLILIILIGLIAGYWFYFKLGMTGVTIPFDGVLKLGLLFIPFVVLVMLGVFSGGVIDGIDGLSGGVLASIFVAFSAIAFGHNQIDLAAFSLVIAGGTLAFLWFNIPPARFYMGETGMLGLTVTLTTIAFLTDSVLILPIVALPLVLTSLSVIIQWFSKKFRNGKRVFRVAPLHHHFQAKGWPPYKVTMRYWIISVVCAVVGVIISFIS